MSCACYRTASSVRPLASKWPSSEQGVMLPAGPATLALRSGAPLLPAAIYFGKAGHAHTLVFRPPIELPPGGPFPANGPGAVPSPGQSSWST